MMRNGFYFLILAIPFFWQSFFSFLRSWFSGNKISKKFCSISTFNFERNDLGKRIFFASVISEILTYAFFLHSFPN